MSCTCQRGAEGTGGSYTWAWLVDAALKGVSPVPVQKISPSTFPQKTNPFTLKGETPSGDRHCSLYLHVSLWERECVQG